MLRDEAALLDMAKFAQTILELMQGFDEASFSDDIRTQSAVLYQLTILGEVVKRLSNEFRQAHPEIPWKEMAGMPDKLISCPVKYLSLKPQVGRWEAFAGERVSGFSHRRVNDNKLTGHDITHQYDRVKLDVVWLTVQRDIPEFLEKLTPLLPQQDD